MVEDVFSFVDRLWVCELCKPLVPSKYVDSGDQEDLFDQNGDGEGDKKATEERNFSNLGWSSRIDARRQLKIQGCFFSTVWPSACMSSSHSRCTSTSVSDGQKFIGCSGYEGTR